MCGELVVAILSVEHVRLFVEPCYAVRAAFTFKLRKVIDERLRKEIEAGATVLERDHAKVVTSVHSIS